RVALLVARHRAHPRGHHQSRARPSLRLLDARHRARLSRRRARERRDEAPQRRQPRASRHAPRRLTMAVDTTLRLEGLVKHFVRDGRTTHAAVSDVSLTVEPGELVTLLGPSGCGKTTTLRMIAGFEQPDEGRVYIGGQDVTQKPVYR